MPNIISDFVKNEREIRQIFLLKNIKFPAGIILKELFLAIQTSVTFECILTFLNAFFKIQ